MPEITQGSPSTPTREQRLAEFLSEARQKFGEQYRVRGMPSILIARQALEYAVEHGGVPPETGLQSLRDPNAFASMLLEEEARYKKREDQRLHTRMSKLERGTHWLIGLSMGAAFLFASPFVSTWLQPTADELFKRPARPEAVVKNNPAPAQPQIVQNITNNYFTLPPVAQKAPQHPAAHTRPHHVRAAAGRLHDCAR